MKVYPATLADLDYILKIQDLSYYEIEPESKESMASKIISSPDTCFVVKDEQGIKGYLLSIPAVLGDPPKLDSETQEINEAANCLYLHDLAIHPEARGMGVGKLLFQAFAQAAYQKQFERASLISIQDSVPFWEKYGFQRVSVSDKLKEKLVTYGDNATYMECYLPSYFPQ